MLLHKKEQQILHWRTNQICVSLSSAHATCICNFHKILPFIQRVPPAGLCRGTGGKMWKPQDLCVTYFSFYGSSSSGSKQNGWQAATVKFPAHRRHLMHCARRICCQDIAAGLGWRRRVIFLQSCCGKSEKLQRQQELQRHNLQHSPPSAKCTGTVWLSNDWAAPKNFFPYSRTEVHFFLFPRKHAQFNLSHKLRKKEITGKSAFKVSNFSEICTRSSTLAVERKAKS